ncbi:MAG: hypothetical protein GY838_19385 [bacterium]|nr:hypothetical protein [bacterium]
MGTTCVRRLLGGVLAALSLVCIPLHATAEDPPRERVLDLLRSGDAAAALPLLRTYAADHPGDAVMLYNLACAEAGAGSSDAATAAVRSALAAGFEDLDGLRADPDLASLRDDPAFDAILTEEASRLILLARERGTDLAEGRRTGPLPLVRPDAPGAGDEPEIHLRWQPLGLEIELAGGGVWTGLADAGAPPPWSGGPAITVTLAAPGERRDYASDNTWILVFGMIDKQPAGALYLPGRDQWQPIGELDPQLEIGPPDRLRFRTTIPWRTIRPFHPLAEGALGLNVSIRVPRPGGGYQVAELLPDPARFAPATARRRTVRLDFDPASTSAEAFVGRVTDSVSRGGVLPLDFTAVVREAGRGSLSMDFLDADGNSVLPGGAHAANRDFTAGVNRLEHMADFSGLRMGTYQVRAELVFPAGARSEWSTTILHLPPGWDDELDTRIAALATRDRPTAAHLLDLVREALAGHVPRRHPGAVATTLGQLTILLDRAERSGGILPDRGAFALVRDGARGPQVVEGVRSAGGPGRRDMLPVIVLTDAAGYENRLVQRLQLFDSRQPIDAAAGGPAAAYLVPHPGTPADDPRDLTAILDWALDYFECGYALLVGVDGLADDALALAARRPDNVAAVAVFAGGHVGLPDGLDGLRAELPVTWFDFPLETAAAGDAVRLRGLLGERGAAAVEDRRVRGGLSMSQVADRTVLWARERAAAD